MAKFFVLSKAPSVTTKAAKLSSAQISEMLQRSPAVTAFMRTNKPSSDLKYKLTFQSMVDATFLGYPVSAQTADGLDRAWRQVIGMLGGYQYVAGTKVPMENGVSVMGEMNKMLIQNYDAEVAKRKSGSKK